jgi:hypothetical protein
MKLKQFEYVLFTKQRGTHSLTSMINFTPRRDTFSSELIPLFRGNLAKTKKESYYQVKIVKIQKEKGSTPLCKRIKLSG